MKINNKVLFSISNMIRTFEVLLISIFLSRFLLDKNSLGQLLQIIFVSSILVTVISGMPLSLNFFYGKYSESEKKHSLFVKLFVTLSLTAVVFLYSNIFSQGYYSNNL